MPKKRTLNKGVGNVYLGKYLECSLQKVASARPPKQTLCTSCPASHGAKFRDDSFFLHNRQLSIVPAPGHCSRTDWGTCAEGIAKTTRFRGFGTFNSAWANSVDTHPSLTKGAVLHC